MVRKPMALANWKMAMTIAESWEWVRDFRAAAGDLLNGIDVVVCPPYTALWAVIQALGDSPIQVGGQNIAPTAELSRTGEISAALLADVGCQRVMLGHWEVRRYLHDDDETVNRKVHLALEAGLSPILLVGEGRDDPPSIETALEKRLEAVLAGCTAEQVMGMAFIYEPEAAIGATKPVTPDHVAAGSGFIRKWVQDHWGANVANSIRIIYGGSVAPEYAHDLLSCPDVDGLGAGRRGRDPESFTEIVRQIVRVKSE